MCPLLPYSRFIGEYWFSFCKEQLNTKYFLEMMDIKIHKMLNCLKYVLNVYCQYKDIIYINILYGYFVECCKLKSALSILLFLQKLSHY